MLIKWANPAVCVVIEPQPGAGLLGEAHSSRSLVPEGWACQPEDAVHVCEEFLTRKASQAEGQPSSLQPFWKTSWSLADEAKAKISM